MKTVAGVLRQAGSTLSVEEIELTDPRDDEVLVRLVGTGLCHTDLVVMETATAGQMPIVLGHEGSGVVEAVGDRVTKVEPGDHVVLSYAYCGTCNNCRRGLMAHCAQFLPLNLLGARGDGTSAYSGPGGAIKGHFFGQSSFGGFSVTTERNCIPVGDDVPLELLGPLGCGVQTGAGTVMNHLKPAAGSSIAVFATGSVGLSAVLGAVVSGCTTIVAVDPIASRRDLARTLGATHVIDPTTEDPARAIVEITAGGVEYSVDCVGFPDVVRAAVECLTAPGTCATVGFQGMNNQISLNLAQMGGRTLVGVVEGSAVPDVFIPRMIELYRQGRFPFDKIIETVPFADVNKAIEASLHGDLAKAVLTF